jgi:GAF domain-containing protein
MSNAPGADAERLAQAQRTISEQAAEIQALRDALAEQDVVQRLRDAIQVAGTVGTITAPVSQTRLVEVVVDVAARVIRAGAASLFLLDEASDELVMHYPLGPKAPEIRHLRVPVGTGIAGLVAVNGQPMAIAEASADPRHAADIAEQIGYAPESILCVPLIVDDEVTGVLEVFDKQGAAGFSSDDMELLSQFAELAAIAIEQARTHSNLGAFIGDLLSSLTPGATPATPEARQQVQALAATLEAGPTYQRSMEIARLVQEIGQFGESELELCQATLEDVRDYLRRRSSLSGGARSRP